MKHFTYESKYGTYEDSFFNIGRYSSNNNLAISIVSQTEGPITNVTVNTDVKLPDDLIAVKDYSENEGMVDWLYSLDIIESVPTQLIPSGYVKIPVFRLTKVGKEFIFGDE